MAKISGPGVGLAFKHESGKHCVQRVPPTETKCRKQTSMVSVAVLPIKEEVEMEPLKDAELKIEPVNLGGAGGQHQNRTLSGCRMTHLPTGLKVCINGRDYHANEREARKVLASRVYDKLKSENDAEYGKERNAILGNTGRGDKVRTYNFMESRVVDHRLGKKCHDVKSIMKGDFGKLLNK